MKVTIKPKQVKEDVKVPFDEIPVGYVYVAKYSNGLIVLKLNDNEAVLLNYSRSDDALFMVSNGFKGEPAVKILGKLTEIIVEEV